MRENVLVYSDKGVSPHYLRHVVRWLKGFLPPEESGRVRLVDGNFLLYEPLWEESTRVLIIPGGADRPYHNTLHGLGTARIDHYVREGGCYLGICAGAYFACRSLSFLEPDGVRYTGSRSLGFFPGRAVGPAYPGVFSYTSSAGVRVALLCFEPLRSCGLALFNGGPYFEDVHTYPGVCVEACYEDLPNRPAAIISRQVGLGYVVLSGPHIEFLPEHCTSTEDRMVYAREALRKEGTVIQKYRDALLSRLLYFETGVLPSI